MNDHYLHREKELLQRIADGDDTAFDLLFRAYWDHVFSVALLMTKSADMANDIGQEIFLSLLKDRAKLTSIENIKGFLYSGVKYMVYKRMRHLKVEEAYGNYLASRPVSLHTSESSDTAVHLKELQRSLSEALKLLPNQQRRAFHLSRDHGLSHEQISIEMGVSKKTVKDYIVRALAFLRNYLKQYGGLIILLILFQHSPAFEPQLYGTSYSVIR